MAFEIEFLPVDCGSKSGDAITMRWTENGQYKYGVIDGGTKESGQTIVDHIKTHYGAIAELDFVLNTHPDSDHCSGLTVVLENFKVKALWMHLPWDYSRELLQFIDDERVSENSLERRLKEKLARAYELKKLADQKGIKIYEPFQGTTVGPFTVLSPSKEWYHELVSQFRNMPSSKNESDRGLLSKAADVIRAVAESFHIETLREDGETSAENESSVVLYGNLEGRTKALLTGDVGIKGLTKACDYADQNFPGWNQNLRVVQIPHHGSRRNVSPSVLNRLLGEKTTEERGWAYCSSSKDSETHPRKSVINAFIRRGYKCCATQGYAKRHYWETGERTGWSSIAPIAFFNEVEEYD